MLMAAFVFYLLPGADVRADDPCSLDSSISSIVRCVETRSPDIQKVQLELRRARTEVGAAGQWKNPEFSVNSVQGRIGAQNSEQTDVMLGVPVEIGGKISARTASAQAKVSQAEAEVLEAQVNARSQALLKLHRYRQLRHERELIEESIATFSKLVTKYAGRPKLAPEQELTLTVFRMAKSDYELKRAEVADELVSVESFFRVQADVEITSFKGQLPDSPNSWPVVDKQLILEVSPRVRAAVAELKGANARLEIERSEAWPTLTVGPSLQRQKNGSQVGDLYGLNLSFPIPMFNANGSAKAAAAAGVRLAEVSKQLTLREQGKLRDELSRVYQQSVAVLASTLSHQEIESRHSSIERLFLSGLVPSAMVIEAHRTFVDLEKSHNAREFKALEALAALYAQDGKSLEL